MFQFEHSSPIQCEQRELFEYHARPGALNRLIPPWENVRIRQRSDSLAVGSEVILTNSVMGMALQWHARHTELNPPYQFQDIQVTGPLKAWTHNHIFLQAEPGNSTLVDQIEYEPKFGFVGKLGEPWIAAKLKAMFAYRHLTTRSDIRLQQFLRPFAGGRVLRFGVTGSTGLIGRRLVDLISVLGHQAVRILRPDSIEQDADYPLSAQKVVWDPRTGFSDRKVVEDLDAVIHLSGKGIASGRWTAANKQAIRNSRVAGTQALVKALRELSIPPRALVCASGVGIYGDRGDAVLDESASIGDDFLANLARDWEAAAREYQSSGNRVVCGRLGVALHPQYGALAKLVLPFQLGLGGPMGDGKQFWSWIHVDDAAAAFLYLAMNPACSGAYNLVAPEQIDNRTFCGTLARVLHRPSLLPAPTFAMRLLLGEMADAMLLSSTRASCQRLVDEGFPFRSETLEQCLRHVLGR